MEEENPLENKEHLDAMQEFNAGWLRYLALSTALIAVIAALSSLLSGTYANQSLLEKNSAILAQSQASDQWNFYQAKGIKKAIAELQKGQDSAALVDRYSREQEDIKKQAEVFEEKMKESNERSEALFERHHKAAFGVTLFQVAIALSAMAVVMRKKTFWVLSIVIAMGGLGLLLMALL